MIAALASLLWLAQAGTPAGGGEAEALFREGLKAYDSKQYARAIEAFEAAHKLSPLPEILFDIAMARRALGDCGRAVEGFDAFIAAAPADDLLLARARARRAELGSCAASDQKDVKADVAAAETRPPALAPLRTDATVPPAAPSILIAPSSPLSPPLRERSWLRNTCFASIGGTTVLGIGGLVFGVQALSSQNEAESAMIWDPAAERADARGRALGQVATTLLVSAGVTTAIAVASCVVAGRSK